MYKASLIKNNKCIGKNIPLCFRLIGRYVVPKSYGDLVIRAIRNELASFYTFTASGSLKSYGYLFAGSIELLQSGQDLTPVAETFKLFIRAVRDTVIDSIDIETADNLCESLEVIITELLKKDKDGVDIRMVREYLPDILNFLLKAESCYITYKL